MLYFILLFVCYRLGKKLPEILSLRVSNIATALRDFGDRLHNAVDTFFVILKQNKQIVYKSDIDCPHQDREICIPPDAKSSYLEIGKNGKQNKKNVVFKVCSYKSTKEIRKWVENLSADKIIEACNAIFTTAEKFAVPPRPSILPLPKKAAKKIIQLTPDEDESEKDESVVENNKVVGGDDVSVVDEDNKVVGGDDEAEKLQVARTELDFNDDDIFGNDSNDDDGEDDNDTEPMILEDKNDTDQIVDEEDEPMAEEGALTRSSSDIVFMSIRNETPEEALKRRLQSENITLDDAKISSYFSNLKEFKSNDTYQVISQSFVDKYVELCKTQIMQNRIIHQKKTSLIHEFLSLHLLQKAQSIEEDDTQSIMNVFFKNMREIRKYGLLF